MSRNQVFGDRHGVALVLTVLLLLVFIGLCALSIDGGMLLAARTEAQRAADAGALSGALSLLEAPGNEDLARERAIETAGQNLVRNVGAEVLPSDVEVDMDDERIRVWVRRLAARGNAMVNLFAQVLGFPTTDVTAMGAARLAVANGVNCPLPMALVDRWWESGDGRLATQEDEWEDGTDVYNEGPLDEYPGDPSLPTGFGEPDRGSILKIFHGNPSVDDPPVPGWFYQLDIGEPGGGGAEVRAWIEGCPDPDALFEYDMDVWVQTGVDIGNMRHGFEGLIGQDASAYWGTGPNSPPGGCVFRPGEVDEDGENVCVSSPRVKPAFLMSPEEVPTESGKQQVTLQNFVGLFVICAGVLNEAEDGCTGNLNSDGAGVHVRFIDYAGVDYGPQDFDDASLVKVLQLVE